MKSSKRKAVVRRTPTPWRLFESRGTTCINGPTGDLGGLSDCVVNWSGFDSSNKPRREQSANARYIVKACNAHERLVEFVKQLSDMLPATSHVKADADKFLGALGER